MIKICIVTLLSFVSLHSFSQQKIPDSSKVFLLIARYKADMKTPEPEALKANQAHWGAFIGDLAQSGNLVNAFRPSSEGATISGLSKVIRQAPYEANKEIIGSVFIIKAATMAEALALAKNCPIYEFDGSVEIRAISMGVN